MNIENQLLNKIVNWANSLFPLYHGTDMRIVQMSEEERSALRNDCETASQYLWEILSIYKDDSDFISRVKEDPVRWYNLENAITCYNACLNGNRQYQYDVFHLTTTRIKAEHYAIRSFAFGEIRLIPYRMYDAIKQIDLKEWNPDNKVEKAIEHIVNFAEEYNEKRPVVFEFNNLDFEKIEIERIGSIWNLLGKWSSLNDKDLTIYYRGTIHLDVSKAIELNKHE